MGMKDGHAWGLVNGLKVVGLEDRDMGMVMEQQDL